MKNPAASDRRCRVFRGWPRATPAPAFKHLALLSLVLLLAACATTKPPPPRLIAEPEIVEVERPVHVDLPGELTEPLAYPELPEGELTNSALSDDIEAWRGVVDQCNADRARIRDLEARSRLGREDDP